MENQKREKTFVVSLKGLGPWVSAIRYEKGAKDVKLFITLEKETKPAVIVEDIALGGKLSEKIFSNLEYHPALSLYLSLLSRQDFAECSATSGALRNCLLDLRNSMFDSSFLLLAQAPASALQGFLWTQKQSIKEKISARFPSETKGNWVLVHIEGDLESAKEHILSLVSQP